MQAISRAEHKAATKSVPECFFSCFILGETAIKETKSFFIPYMKSFETFKRAVTAESPIVVLKFKNPAYRFIVCI